MLKLRLQVGSISTMVDGGNKLTLYTPEIPPDVMSELFRLKKEGECIGAFEPIDRVAPELAPVVGETSEGKTPAQRLRSVLYVYFTQVLNKTSGFEAFYTDWIEDKINKVKSCLPPQ